MSEDPHQSVKNNNKRTPVMEREREPTHTHMLSLSLSLSQTLENSGSTIPVRTFLCRHGFTVSSLFTSRHLKDTPFPSQMFNQKVSISDYTRKSDLNISVGNSTVKRTEHQLSKSTRHRPVFSGLKTQRKRVS